MNRKRVYPKKTPLIIEVIRDYLYHQQEHPTYDDLMWECQCTQRTIVKALRHSEKVKALLVERRPGLRNHYSLPEEPGNGRH